MNYCDPEERLALTSGVPEPPVQLSGSFDVGQLAQILVPLLEEAGVQQPPTSQRKVRLHTVQGSRSASGRTDASPPNTARSYVALARSSRSSICGSLVARPSQPEQ